MKTKVYTLDLDGIIRHLLKSTSRERVPTRMLLRNRIRRKLKEVHEMTPAQGRIYDRVRACVAADKRGMDLCSFLAEDGRSANIMFHREWLRWNMVKGQRFVLPEY